MKIIYVMFLCRVFVLMPKEDAVHNNHYVNVFCHSFL